MSQMLSDHFVISQQNYERARFFVENYVRLDSRRLPLDRRTVIGEREPRICRFCKKGKDETRFRMDAHAFPELLGKCNLLTYHECDTCNKAFATVENDLGNFLGPSRTLAQLHGKRGVPTLKIGKSRIEMGEDGLHIQIVADEHCIVLDEETRKLRFNIPRQPYIPVAVYKSFVKMALSVIPKSELEHLSETVKWVRAVDHSSDGVTFSNLPLIERFTPGPSPFPGVHAELLKRKEPQPSENPAYIFVIAFRNWLYQCFLPLSSMDSFDGKISMAPWIDIFEDSPFGPSKSGIHNLAGKEVRRDDAYALTMGYQRAEVIQEQTTDSHSTS